MRGRHPASFPSSCGAETPRSSPPVCLDKFGGPVLTACMIPSIDHAAGASTGKTVSQWSGASREQGRAAHVTAIAARYDLNNSLLSFGLHHRWKALAASHIPVHTHGAPWTWARVPGIWPCCWMAGWGRTAGWRRWI